MKVRTIGKLAIGGVTALSIAWAYNEERNHCENKNFFVEELIKSKMTAEEYYGLQQRLNNIDGCFERGRVLDATLDSLNQEAAKKKYINQN